MRGKHSRLQRFAKPTFPRNSQQREIEHPIHPVKKEPVIIVILTGYRLLPSANRVIAPLFLNSMVFWHKNYVRIKKKICIFKIQIKSKYILNLIFTTVMINERISKILNYSNYSKVASH